MDSFHSGLKDTLFHEHLLSDSWLLLLAGGLILLVVLAFVGAVFLALATVAAVAFSLGLAYFVYTFVLGVKFFPFMNVLAVVIAVGE